MPTLLKFVATPTSGSPAHRRAVSPAFFLAILAHHRRQIVRVAVTAIDFSIVTALEESMPGRAEGIVGRDRTRIELEA